MLVVAMTERRRGMNESLELRHFTSQVNHHLSALNVHLNGSKSTGKRHNYLMGNIPSGTKLDGQNTKGLGKVVKVENFNVETLSGHGVLRSKCKLELKVDRG